MKLIYQPPPPPTSINNINTSNTQKPIVIICFSSVKAKTVAQNLANNSEFSLIYTSNSIYYLDCGIMEAFESGLEIIEGVDGIFEEKHTEIKPKNPLIAKTIADLKERYLASKKAWVVTFSGGKDSTCVLQLVYEMLVSLPSNLRRPTFAIASNTLVEAPHIDKFLHSVIASINAHAKANNIPFEVFLVSPSLKDDFWVNLIGKGYPSPTRTFRWCTERLKINPAKAKIAEIANKFGSCLLLLGSRKAESTNRKKSIEKRILNEDGYSLHHDYPNAMTFSPISEWSTDEVWAYLISHKPLWEKDHSELFSLYAKASGEECQFITDLSQSSCGGSRFGCWVCTVVNEDKSMQGFIESGAKNLKPLNEFRNFIKALREDSRARSDYRRDGRAAYKVGGLGPFLSHARVKIFEKLLEVETQFKANDEENLISDSQILAIQKEWDKDFDFNNTAITIAKKFNRLKEMKMKKHEVLHSEILEEVANEKLNASELEQFIASVTDIYKSTGLRGRSNANIKIKDEVKKLIDDKTSKIKMEA